MPASTKAALAAPASPSIADEVAYISGVTSDGKVAPISAQTWNGDVPSDPDATTPAVPATYNTMQSNAAKWAPGGTTAGPSAIGSAGGLQYYYFDTTSTFTAGQRVALAAGLKMWSAVANIQFAEITAAEAAANPSKASLDFQSNTGNGTYESSGGGTPVPIGSSQLYNQGAGTFLTVDTGPNGFDVGNFNNGGSGVGVILHEEGHFMGLGHPGPYNGAVNPATQQFSAYDSHEYTLMSYISANEPTGKYAASNPNPGATPYGDSTTWMPLDILAIQSLYGVATTGPLSGGQVFGYHDNVDGLVAHVGIHDFFDFSAITTPVVTLYDTGTGNTLDLSGDSSMETIDLRAGHYSSFAGLTYNLAIAYNTAIDTFVGGTGGTNVTVNGNADTIKDSGTNNTVNFLGTFASYTIAVINPAKVTVTYTTTGIKDVLEGVQTLVFADKTVQTASLVPAPISATSTTPAVATTDEKAASPFSGVVITDPNSGQTETAVVTLSSTASGPTGTLSDAAGGTVSGSTYTVSGTASTVAAALNALVFTPTAHQVTPGQSVLTTLTANISDTAGQKTSIASSVTATAVNDAPTISGAKAGQATSDTATIKPFATTVVSDPDTGVQDSLTIVLESGSTPTGANGTLSGTGLVPTGAAGTYTLAAASPTALTAELQALVFTPTPHQGAGGSTVTTTFMLTASQTAGGSTTTATNSATTVVVTETSASNVINGPAGGFGVLNGTSGADLITAHGKFNAIFGNGGADTINAGDGAAYVDVAGGSASVTLGGSFNAVTGGNGNVTVKGAPDGYTAVTLGNGNDVVQIGGQHDVILLGNGTNLVSGTQGMAFITTGWGNDTIKLGGSGSTVNAGGGTNTITGGAGCDTFVLPKASQGFDSITGFTEANGDVLDLRAALAATGWNHQAATLGNYLKVTDSGGSTTLLVAPTGSGGGTAVALLNGAGNLHLADLLSHHSLQTG